MLFSFIVAKPYTDGRNMIAKNEIPNFNVKVQISKHEKTKINLNTKHKNTISEIECAK